MFRDLSRFVLIFGTKMLSYGAPKICQNRALSGLEPPGVPKGPSTEILTVFVIGFGACWCRSGRCLKSGRPALRSSNKSVNLFKVDTMKAYEFDSW